MKLVLEKTKEFKGWAFRLHDTRKEVVESTVFLLPHQIKRVEEIIKELQKL